MLGAKRYVAENRPVAVVTEADMIENNIANNLRERGSSLRVAVFRLFGKNLVCPLQAGDCFGELRTDRNHLNDGRDQETEKQCVSEEAAHRKGARQYLPRSDVHDDGANHSEQHAGGEAHKGRSGQRTHDIVEQALHTGREYGVLPFFGVISLNHPHAAERFRQAPGNLGIDLAALAKNGTNSPKGFVQRQTEAQQENECHQCHHRADAKEHDQSNA